MPTFIFKNNAVSALAVGIDDIATALVLTSGQGSRFPSPGAGQLFPITLVDSGGNIEICYCTNRTGDTLTISRGEELTTPRSWLIGDIVSLRITDGFLTKLLQDDGLVVTNTNADKVDGFDANATPTANQLLPLNGSAILPTTAQNAETLEGQNSAYHLDRANHTGTQPYTTITGLGLLATVNSVQQMFTGAGAHNFTVPEGVTSVNVVMCGGGGGGGNTAFADQDNYTVPGGGGLAGAVNYFTQTVVPGAIIPINIGAGGTAGAVGGTTTFINSAGPLAGTVDGATQTNPVVITDTAHGLNDGDMIRITGVGGMTQINDRDFKITLIDPNTFSLDDEDGTGHGAFSGAGTWTKYGPVTAAGGLDGYDSNPAGNYIGRLGANGDGGAFGTGGKGGTNGSSGSAGTHGGGGGGAGGGGFNGNGASGGAGGAGVVWIFW